MSSGEETMDTIKTSIPARLDRLPWSKFHWMVVIGLGTVWILDGLEVTLVGSIGARLTEADSGLHLGASQIGTAAAIYVAGAVIGALFFGQLTDRFGRKKLFLITLGLYVAATIATAFSFAPWYFFICRFFTGAGIGGEYSAINSAIDELIPARVRGRVDLLINGSFWAGSAMAALASIFLLDTALFAADVGWRLAFALGAVFGIAILFVRRNVPESPRWLFIHGREDEANEIVTDIEKEIVEENDGEKLSEPDTTIEVEQRKTVSMREVANTAFRKYPRRTALCLALFTGQAFLYNAITFDLGTLLGEFYGIASGAIPIYIVIYAASNFLGPITLGRYFDTIGRKPMIVGTYGIAAVGAIVMAVFFTHSGFNVYWFMAVLILIFFFASAGASSAYLTVSEIFPMETRALAIAFFYAIGTGLGGIIGPLLFGHLIASGDKSTLAIGFYLGGAIMAVGAIAELMWGVKAENKSLEDIAEPLSATGEGSGTGESGDGEPGIGSEGEATPKEPAATPATTTPGRRPVTGRWQRYRPGPASVTFSRGYPLQSSAGPVDAGPEIEALVKVLEENGEMSREELAQKVGARRWGPGRFRFVLTQAREGGRIELHGRRSYALPEGSNGR